MGDVKHTKSEAMTLRLYRKQLTGDHSGITEDEIIYVGSILEKYRPIKNEKHLILMMAAHGGLQWGKLKPFSDLVKSGYPIPEKTRLLFCDLVEGKCRYGYVVNTKLHKKYRGHLKRTPMGQVGIFFRDFSMWRRFKVEMDKPENNRTTASSIRHKQRKYWLTHSNSKYHLSETTFKKIVEGKEPNPFD